MATLSERLINGSKDIVDQIINSDYVQKVLLTGEQNTELFQRILRYYSAAVQSNLRSYPKILGIPNLNASEKDMFEKMTERYPETQNKYIEGFTAAVGGSAGPVNPQLAEYLAEQEKKFEGLIAKGSIIHVLVVLLPGYAVPFAVQNYLVAHNYKQNPLTDFAIQKSIPLDRIVGGVKTRIDDRASEVNSDLEAELIGLYRKVAEGQLARIQRLSS